MRLLDSLRQPGGPRIRVAAGVGAVLLLVLPSAVLLLGHSYQPASDWALMELRTRDVFSAHPPLIGAYSRYGWAHPGPLPYYVLALPYQLLGAQPEALLWAALLFNSMVVGVILWIANRRGTSALLGASILVTAVVRTATLPMVMHDPWNASLVVLPFVLLLVCSWCALCGDDVAALVGAFAFLFVVQAHVGYAVVATPLFLVTSIVVWRRRRHRGARLSTGRRITLGAVVGVMVLPVVIDTFANWPGNAGRLIRWSLTDQEAPAAGLGTAADILLRASSLSYLVELRLPVFVNSLEVPMSGGVLPGICLLLFVVAGVWAFRSGHIGARSAVTCLTVLWLSIALAMANLRGPLLEWLFGWLAPVVWATWLTIAGVGWVAVRSRQAEVAGRRRLDALLAAVAVVLVVSLGVAQIARVREEPFEWQAVGGAAVVMSAAAREAADGRPMHLGYDSDTPDAQHLMSGMLNILDRDGVRLQVADDWALLAGGHRTSPLRDALELEVAQQAVSADREGWREVAVYDECDPITRAEVDELTAELSALLSGIGRDDLVPALSTAGASIVLAAEKDPSVQARRADIQRLEQLRRAGAMRYVLYAPLPEA